MEWKGMEITQTHSPSQYTSSQQQTKSKGSFSFDKLLSSPHNKGITPACPPLQRLQEKEKEADVKTVKCGGRH